MPREINRLTTKTVEALQEPGLHADGAGLYLRIDQTLNKRWVYVFFWRGKRREMGLGSAAPTAVSLKDARKAASTAREQVSNGVDPIAARKLDAAAQAPRTFGEQAEAVISDLEPGWRSAKAGPQWRASLKQHARHIWKMPVAEVDTEAVLEVLKPIWLKYPETARRVRMRIERILDVARIEGRREGENPARLRGHIQLLLARQAIKRGHHTAMPYEQVPAFMARLRERKATAARALEFTILAATRSTETREALWSEIQGDLWIIPAARMKAGREHRVPLTPRMLEILEEMKPLRTPADHIFPGDLRIEPISNMAMLRLLQHRMEVDVTVHGFRSAFRDWAGDCTDHPRDVTEAALAHAVGGAVERAYRRRDALAKRRELMVAWETFCTTPPLANVIPFARA